MKLVADGMRMSSEYKAAILHLQKAKANYEVKCKEAESINQSFHKAKNDTNIKQKKLTELSGKATKALDIANQADKEYQKALLRANERQSRFYEVEMPSILEIFQRFEEERIQFLKDIFEKFAILQKDFPSYSQDVFIGVSNAAQIINVKLDIQQFIEQSRTGITSPSPINYEPYNDADGSIPLSFTVKTIADPSREGAQESFVEDEITPIINDERVIKLQYQLSELNEIIEGESRTKKGMEKLVKFYSKDANAQEKAKNDLVEQKAKIKKFKEHRTHLESKLTDLCNSITNPVTTSNSPLIDSSQKSPPQPRSTNFNNDKVKSNDNLILPDLNGNITNSKNNAIVVTKKKKRLSNSENNKNNINNDHKNNDQSKKEIEGDELSDELIEEVSLPAKAIYDYEATSKKELSIKENDILTVTEQDDSGWWFVTFQGKKGFVPSNYIKLL